MALACMLMMFFSNSSERANLFSNFLIPLVILDGTIVLVLAALISDLK